MMMSSPNAPSVSSTMSNPDWVYSTAPRLGPGPGPVLRPLVPVQGNQTTTPAVTGTSSVLSLQPFRGDF